jgi:hypothetical protein
MKKTVAAAMVGIFAFSGAATASVVVSPEPASAETISVCKRQVYDEIAGVWYCAEWSTCWYDSATGEWACNDGIYGGPPRLPHPPVQT